MQRSAPGLNAAKIVARKFNACALGAILIFFRVFV
jgi:hypothetical protein